MQLKHTKVLVTGASGFVGSHLTEELINNGAEVTATTHHPLLPHSYFKIQQLDNKCKVVQIDLTDFKQVQKLITHNPQPTTHNQFDYIFHLAAQPLVDKAFDDPGKTFSANIMGTVNILECARQVGLIKGIIVASSDKAYGKMTSFNIQHFPPEADQPLAETFNKKTVDGNSREGMNFAVSSTSRAMKNIWSKTQTPFASALDETKNLYPTVTQKYKESDPLAGDHPYESSKSSADLIAQTYFKTYGLPVVITRFGNIYGEGDIHFSRLVPGIMKALVNKETFDIRSNGKYIRDYLYVKDVVKGYLMLAENMDKVKGEAFNFGSNDTYSVLSLISLISQICQIEVNYKILNTAKNEIPYQSLDWTKIRKTLGWKPEYDLKKTLGNIFQWYKDSLSFIGN